MLEHRTPKPQQVYIVRENTWNGWFRFIPDPLSVAIQDSAFGSSIEISQLLGSNIPVRLSGFNFAKVMAPFLCEDDARQAFRMLTPADLAEIKGATDNPAIHALRL